MKKLFSFPIIVFVPKISMLSLAFSPLTASVYAIQHHLDLSHPVAVDYAYEEEYPLRGCATLVVGSGLGTNMQSSTGSSLNDGEGYASHGICAGN